ncbi:MAG TPA: hypothetical protein DDW83_08660 [Peptococcaceae bacterium]|nr:hypothetical protein [Peptococcaceae bacterium]
MFPRKLRYSISVLLVGLLITLLPVTAFAATRYIHYQGSLSDQLLTRILQQVFPGDDIKIIRSEWKQQPQPEPVPQPEQEPEPEQGSEPQPEQEPTPEQGSEPQPEPEPTPEQGSEPQPEPEPAPKPEQDPQPQTEPEPAPSSMSQYEQQMVNLVNQERQQAGLKPLTVDSRLVNLARLKSQDMINKNYFNHQSPTYGSPFDMMKNAGVTYRWAGENIAGAGGVDRAHNGLMNSEGHRANILNSNFTHIGIGIVPGGPYGMMFTQMFIGVN